MATINNVTMIGRLTRDPQSKQVNNLTACVLSIATEHKQKKKDGTWQEEVCFIDTTVWGATADACVRHLKKGSTVAIEGRLKLEKWTDKTTQMERTRHVIVAQNVVFMDPKQSAENLAEAEMPKAATAKARMQPTTLPNKPPYKAAEPTEESDFDDTLPF